MQSKFPKRTKSSSIKRTTKEPISAKTVTEIQIPLGPLKITNIQATSGVDPLQPRRFIESNPKNVISDTSQLMAPEGPRTNEGTSSLSPGNGRWSRICSCS